MTKRANHVSNLLALGSYPSLVLIRKTAETERNGGRLRRIRLNAVVLRIKAVRVAWPSRPAI